MNTADLLVIELSGTPRDRGRWLIAALEMVANKATGAAFNDGRIGAMA